jgi:hypothetical protein
MIRVVDCRRTYPATPWMLEHVESGAPVALVYLREVADVMAEFWNRYAGPWPLPQSKPEGT